MGVRRNAIALACVTACLGYGAVMLNGQSGNQSPGAVSQWLRQQIVGRDLSVNPPRTLSSRIEPLAKPTAAGNAIVRHRFDPKEQLPPRLYYRGNDHKIVTLADDGIAPDQLAGDSTYASLVQIDLAAVRGATLGYAASQTAQPISFFKTRAKVAHSAFIDVAAVKSGGPFDWAAWGDPAAVDPERSLFIRHPSVVQDPTRTRAACGQPSMGPWSFGYLMQQMANQPVTGVSGAELVRNWLDQWTTDLTINGWTIEERDLMITKILDPWIAASGGPGAPLDLSIAPFRLLAIVNRTDLRTNVAFGGTGAGELRFVFGAMKPDCRAMVPPFNLILEYGVPADGCLNVKSWAQQWKNLDTLPIGSTAYNAALEAITRQVVVAGASPSKPNGSAINQVRTNEAALDPAGGIDWEAREFQLVSSTHRLKQATVKQTPAQYLLFGGVASESVAAFVNSNASAIKRGLHTVPLRDPSGRPFRGGASEYSRSTGMWNRSTAPLIVDREARHQFSLQTCNGCHLGETNSLFTHVDPAGYGETVNLSAFLTGGWVDDPADGTPTRYFNELERRATDLNGLLTRACLLSTVDIPLLAAH